MLGQIDLFLHVLMIAPVGKICLMERFIAKGYLHLLVLMQEMLRPIPVALASCTRFFEAMSAMRESFATLQNLRMGHFNSSLPATPAKDGSQRVAGESDCVTPPPWRNEPSFDDLASRSLRRQEIERQEAEDENSEVSDFNQVDGASHRRLSWPPSVKKSGI